MHLIFLIHGLFGNAGHMVSMERSILQAITGKNQDKLVVYRAQAMSAIGTFDGVVENSHKLLSELIECIRKTKATHLSIVGYSMGGLCGRHLVGLLEEAGVFAKVKPVLFATFATPHLGSRYPKNNSFGKFFNFLGPKITGVAGDDLFGCSTVLDDLADPDSVFISGLSKFPHLYIFSNSINDLTVPFWTSYITPKDPFGKRADVRLNSKYPSIVDMLNSSINSSKHKRPHRSAFKYLRRKLLGVLLKLLLPIVLLLLAGVMGLISLIAWLKRKLSVSFKPTSNPGSNIVGKVGSALEEVLEMGSTATNELSDDDYDNSDIESSYKGTYDNEPTLDSHGLKSPGYEGMIDAAVFNIELDPQTQRNLESLNGLHWQKFAVRMTTFNTHGQIVDRRGSSSQGKKLLDFFAQIVAEKHRDVYKPRIDAKL